MRKTWVDFCKKMDIGQDSIPFSHEDWFAWLAYAVKNYQEPLTLAAAGGDWNDQ